ncbi:MAG TPA: phage tail protein [Acidimicrobiales bacterium]|nr:phage tail protein [Acidimicrobiales bacterium]
MSVSTRGLMRGTATPHPLERLLPGPFLDDDEEPSGRKRDSFARRFCAGLDGVLAPVPVTLDCLDAYFDPRLAPLDFLEWLAGWFGVTLDQNWSEPQRRALVRHAGELYRWQGTRRGIAEHIRLYAGVEPEVTDSGAGTWSAEAGGALPGSDACELHVTVTVSADSELDERRLDALVAAAKPAHVRHRVTVVRRAGKK